MLLPQLDWLLVDEVVEEGSGLLIRARTRLEAVACPRCGGLSDRVHAYAGHRRRRGRPARLGEGGLLLLVLAITYEARLREVRRLRGRWPGCGELEPHPGRH